MRTLVLAPTEVDELEQLLDLGLALGLGHAAHLQRQVDVLSRGQPRKQRGLLEHERNLAATGVDGAGARLVEIGDEVEKRALAAAAGPDDAEKLPLCNVQVNLFQGHGEIAAAAERFTDSLDADGRPRSPCGLRGQHPRAM